MSSKYRRYIICTDTCVIQLSCPQLSSCSALWLIHHPALLSAAPTGRHLSGPRGRQGAYAARAAERREGRPASGVRDALRDVLPEILARAHREEPSILTVARLADMLGVTPRTVTERYVKEGMPCYRPGGKRQPPVFIFETYSSGYAHAPADHPLYDAHLCDPNRPNRSTLMDVIDHTLVVTFDYEVDGKPVSHWWPVTRGSATVCSAYSKTWESSRTCSKLTDRGRSEPVAAPGVAQPGAHRRRQRALRRPIRCCPSSTLMVATTRSARGWRRAASPRTYTRSP